MPYDIRWLVDRRVIIEQFHGVVTLDDLREANQDAQPLLAEGIPLVHFIISLADVEKFPTNLAQMIQAMQHKVDPEHMGWVIIYGTQNPLMRFVVSTVTQLVGAKMRLVLVDSMEEAAAFLGKHDESLLPLLQAF